MINDHFLGQDIIYCCVWCWNFELALNIFRYVIYLKIETVSDKVRCLLFCLGWRGCVGSAVLCPLECWSEMWDVENWVLFCFITFLQLPCFSHHHGTYTFNTKPSANINSNTRVSALSLSLNFFTLRYTPQLFLILVMNDLDPHISLLQGLTANIGLILARLTAVLC